MTAMTVMHAITDAMPIEHVAHTMALIVATLLEQGAHASAIPKLHARDNQDRKESLV